MAHVQARGLRQGDLQEAYAQVREAISLYDIRLSTGTVVAAEGGGTHGYAVNDDGIVLIWDATDVTAVGLFYKVPGDYDPEDDVLVLHEQWLNEGTTDDPAIAHAVFVLSEGTATRGADLNPTDPSVGNTHTANTPQEQTVALSGNSLAAGDLLYMTLTPAAHGTDRIELWQFWVTYTSRVIGQNA